MRAYATQLKSGRWQGMVRPDGQPAISKTFDYEYQARDFIANVKRDLSASTDAAASVVAPKPVRPSAARTAPSRVVSASVPAGTPTVGEYARTWHAAHRHTIAVGTLEWHRQCLAIIYADKTLSALPIDAVTREDVKGFMGRIADKGVSVTTRSKSLKVLRSVMQSAMVAGKRGTDPTYRLAGPQTDGKIERVFTRQEDAALMLAIAAAFVPFCVIGLDAGLRWAEIAGLRVIDVDLAEGFIYVRRQLGRNPGELTVTKGKRTRNVPIATDRLRAALATLIGDGRDKTAQLFPQLVSLGAKAGAEHFRTVHWIPACEAAQLSEPRPTPHDMRHTFATRLALAGMPIAELAAVLGHADLKETQRYVHAGTDGHRANLMTAALAV